MRVSAAAYPTEAARAQLIARVLERVRAVPGVVAAATTLNTFTPGGTFVTQVDIEGKPTADGQSQCPFRRISSRVFQDHAHSVDQGTGLQRGGQLQTRGVAVVSRRIADRFWPGEDPIGQGIRRGANRTLWTGRRRRGRRERWRVVAQAPGPTVYLCFTQNNVAITPVSLVVADSGRSRRDTGAVRLAVLAGRSGTADRSRDDDRAGTWWIPSAAAAVSQRAPARARRVGFVLPLSGSPASPRAPSANYARAGRSTGARRDVHERGRARDLASGAGGAPGACSRCRARRFPAGAALLRTLPNLDRAEPWERRAGRDAPVECGDGGRRHPARRAVSVDPTVALRAD